MIENSQHRSDGSSRADLRALAQTEGFPAVERALVQYLKEDPHSYEGFFALSRVLLMRKADGDAIRAAQKTKALAPLEADPHILIGVARMRSKDPDTRDMVAANAAFAEAIRLDPASARAHLGAAVVKLADGQHDVALELCYRALWLDPSLERALEVAARISLKKGDHAAAASALSRLVQANPQNRQALLAYLRVMKSLGREDEALALLEQDATENPEDEGRATRFSLVAARAGQPDKAAEHYRKLLDAHGSLSSGNLVRYAMTLIAANETDKARAVTASMASRRGLNYVAMKLDGDIAVKEGDPEAAVAQYSKTCSAARLDRLPAQVEEGATNAAERAELWKAHTGKVIADALRQRSAKAAEATT